MFETGIDGADGDRIRTPEQPMAFSRDELLRGGVTAWILFVTLLFAGFCFLPAVQYLLGTGQATPSTALNAVMLALIMALIGGLVSLFLMPFGVLIAWPLAFALRRVRLISIHLATHCALGLGVGGAYLVFSRGQHALAPLSFLDVFAIIPAIAAAAAVPLGWWLTARRALRDDAGLRRRLARPDLDAAFEDRFVADGSTTGARS